MACFVEVDTSTLGFILFVNVIVIIIYLFKEWQNLLFNKDYDIKHFSSNIKT